MEQTPQDGRVWFFQALSDSYARLEQHQGELLQELCQTPADRIQLSQELAKMFLEVGLLVVPGIRWPIEGMISQTLLAGCIRWFMERIGLVNIAELQEWTVTQVGWYGAIVEEEEANEEPAEDTLSSMQNGNYRAWRTNRSSRPGRHLRGY